MSDHVFGEGHPSADLPAPNTGGQWSRYVRRLRLAHGLAATRHIYASRLPSVLNDIAVSVETFPDNQWVLTHVETWNRPTALNVLGSDILNAFDATTSNPPSAPLLTVYSADGTVLYPKVPTWSIGVLADRTPYDRPIEG